MIENTPLISVILPTFNRAGVLPRAIDSVLAQSYKSIELIVVDDGSTDDTRQVLERYGNKLICIKQHNRGVSAARNTGIRISKGKYLAFIDSDDKWMESKLEEQVRYFNNYEQDNLALVCTDIDIIDIKGTHHKRRRFMPRNSSCVLDVVDVFRDPYLGLPTVMIRADLVNKDSVFDESLNSAEDIDLYLRLMVNRKAGYIHKKLVDVYQSSNSLSASITSYDDNIRVITGFLKQHKELFVGYESEINQLMHGVFMDYAKTLLWKKKSRASREQLRNALHYKLSAGAVFLYLKSYIK